MEKNYCILDVKKEIQKQKELMDEYRKNMELFRQITQTGGTKKWKVKQ